MIWMDMGLMIDVQMGWILLLLFDFMMARCLCTGILYLKWSDAIDSIHGVPWSKPICSGEDTITMWA